MKSNFLRLDTSDLVKGFVVAFLSASLTGIINILDAGTLPLLSDLKQAGIVGLTAGLSYLLKNLLTNSQDEILKKEA
jgi:hypothetical protein